MLLLGTPTAYLLARRRFPGRALCITLVELPLVLPPAVAGIGLLAAFGRVGLLGSTFRTVGVTLPFTQAAVTMAVAFVAGPLYIRQAIASFEAVDPNLLAASRTLGAGSARTFFRVVLPLARGGLAAGEALAFARGLGEFGATIMFAGSLQKVTQTLPLAIYAEFDVNFDVTLAISALLVFISAALLISFKLDLPMATLRADFRSRFASFELELALEVDGTVALVGPSGAGKTSVLRAIAGLVRPPRGRIALGDDVWLDSGRRIFRKPDERRVGLVFQEYALFPHLTVRQNVAYAGKAARRRVPRALPHLAPRRRAAGDALRRRAPARRTRARARPRPGVILLDEPLSALDAHTKGTVRAELQELLRELALPTILVTPRLRGRRRARRRGRRDRRRALRQLATPQRARRPARRRVRRLVHRRQPAPRHGAPARRRLTLVRLDTGELVYSTEWGEGDVGVVVYPWEVSVGRAAPARLGDEPDRGRDPLGRRTSATASASASARSPPR